MCGQLPCMADVNGTTQASKSKGWRTPLEPAHSRAEVQVPELLEPGLTAYMCGPVPFMAGVQGDLAALGFDATRLYQESFAF